MKTAQALRGECPERRFAVAAHTDERDPSLAHHGLTRAQRRAAIAASPALRTFPQPNNCTEYTRFYSAGNSVRRSSITVIEKALMRTRSRSAATIASR